MTDILSDDAVKTVSESDEQLQIPPQYRVILLNDDYTPMDFVVEILTRFFRKSIEDATRIMLAVHHDGHGVCGLYPREIAETKVMQVTQYARKHDHPLFCRMEKG